MDEYLTLLGTLFGTVLGGVIGFASAYLIERQRFKKESVIEMRDKIYGPMYMEVGKTLDAVKLFETSGYVGLFRLRELMDNYIFSTIRQDLKKRLSQLVDRLEKYQSIRRAAEVAFFDATREAVQKNFNVDIGSNANPLLRLVIGKVMASSLNLEGAVFLRLPPRDFIRKEKEKWGDDLGVDVSIGGQRNLDDFESLYLVVLGMMEKEPLYLTEKEQRMRLIDKLEDLQGQVKTFVSLQ